MISTELSIRACARHSLVSLSGELDQQDAPYVTAVLLALAEREPRIVADLTNLEFIDSSGVTALACGREQARRAGGDLLLAAPGRQVTRMLEATRRGCGFSFYPSVEEAASSIESGRHAVVVPLPGRQAASASTPASTAAASPAIASSPVRAFPAAGSRPGQATCG